MRAISFRDVLRRDFELYRGGWQLEPREAGVWVRHHVTARPATAVPGILLAEAFKATARDLLIELRREIRSKAGSLEPSPSPVP